MKNTLSAMVFLAGVCAAASLVAPRPAPQQNRREQEMRRKAALVQRVSTMPMPATMQ